MNTVKESLVREFLNPATRIGNMENLKEKGTKEMFKMFCESLEQVEIFRCFIVHAFQEIVPSDEIERTYDKLMSMNIELREEVIKEIANRYMQFAQLGYVFTVKSYVDRKCNVLSNMQSVQLV